MTNLTQTVTAGFGGTTDTLVAPNIQITGHEGISDFNLGIPLRCYPPGCKITASVGEIRRGTSQEVEVQGEMIKWSGTKAKLKFYPSSTPEMEALFGFGVKGDVLDPVSIRLTIDMAKGEITSSVSFMGLVKVLPYKALYELFYYKPNISFAKFPKSEFGGLNITFGSIAAYKDGGITIFDVPPTSLVDGTDKVEIYRIISQSVITVDGEWEKPETWDGSYTGTYTSGQTGPDKSNSATKERVHEVGYITRTGGKLWYEKFSTGLAQPYPDTLIKATGTPNFQPVISMRSQNPSQLFKDAPELRGRAEGYISERAKHPLI